MPTSSTEVFWSLALGTSVFLSLAIGLITVIMYSQRRFLAAQEEKFSILKDAKEQFRRLVEDSPVPTAVLRKGTIIYCNTAVVSLLNAPLANDILGKSFSVYFHRNVLKGVREQLNIFLEFDKPISASEVSLLCHDNKLIEVELTAIQVMYEGQPGILIVLRNLTETKRAQEILRDFPRKLLDAEEAERRRVARELHDGVNQILFNVKGQIEILESKLMQSKYEGNGTLSVILDPLKGAMKEIQRISRNLRPSNLDDLGLASAINSMVDEFITRTHIRVTVQGFPTSDRLPSEYELAFFRIVQESLTNIEKYAKATQVLIEYAEEESLIRITITDNGIGIQKKKQSVQMPGSGIGLNTIRERAELLGGARTVLSEPGKGTKIIVIVPRRSNVVPDKEF